MSHVWQKPLNLVASGIVLVGMMGLTATTAGAAPRHAASKTVVISDYQKIDNLNAYQLNQVFDVEVTALTNPNGNYATYEPNGSFKVIAGSQMKSSNHGRTWTFSLNRGMKWSNGDPVTNKDFLFGWHIAMNPNTQACAGTCDDIKSISLAKNGVGITVHLKAAVPGATYNVIGYVPLNDSRWTVKGADGVDKAALTSCLNTSAASNFAGCDKVAKAYEDPATNYSDPSFVVFGPYVVSNWDTASGIVDLVPDKHYTKSMPGGKPKIAHIRFIPYGASTGSTQPLIDAAANGNTDVTMDYSLLDVGNKKTPQTLEYYFKKFKTLVKANAQEEWLFFNERNSTVSVKNASGSTDYHGHNPFAGAKGTRVRQALALAFNRAGIIANTFHVGPKVAASLVSYCAPIICTKSSKAPFSDYSGIKGAWDPLRGKWVTPECAVSKSNGGNGRNNTAVKDALKILSLAGYGKKHPLTVYLGSTTKAYRTSERAYLVACWQALAPWIHVNQEAIPSTTYYADWSASPPGTLAHGWFEASLIGVGGVPPDPNGLVQKYELSSNCPQLAPHEVSTQSNSGCIKDKTIDKAIMKAAHSLSTSVRQKWYNVMQVETVKQAHWIITAPLPQIWTTDGKVKGFQMNAWATAAEWNGYHWT
jgi:ABC-type transport system substrate-binding protein